MIGFLKDFSELYKPAHSFQPISNWTHNWVVAQLNKQSTDLKKPIGHYLWLPYCPSVYRQLLLYSNKALKATTPALRLKTLTVNYH